MPSTDRVTRFAGDLVDSAAVEGARQSRSARQQLDYWTRLGRAVAEQPAASRRRIDAALHGTLPLTQLSEPERVVVHAEIDTAIQTNLRHTDYGAALASRGITTVVLADDGRLMERDPDGRTTYLGAPPVPVVDDDQPGQ